MKFQLLGLVVAFAMSGVSFAGDHDQSSFTAQSGAAQNKCATRVRSAGCLLSNNDIKRIEDNVQECKQVTSGSGKTRLEVFLLRNSDKLVVFQTKGQGVPDLQGRCPLTKYTVDRSGIKDVLIRGNRTWMISNDGQLYLMNPDQTVYEVMNAKDKSYSGITKIKGTNDEDELHIIGNGFDSVLSNDTIVSRKKRQLEFVKTFTFESLFRDK